MSTLELVKQIYANNILLRPSQNGEDNHWFDWERTDPSYGFYYDDLRAIERLPNSLADSKLGECKSVYVDIISDLPVVKMDALYFVENCVEFIDANLGMGSVICSDDYQLVMEATTEEDYMLFSNFLIML